MSCTWSRSARREAEAVRPGGASAQEPFVATRPPAIMSVTCLVVMRQCWRWQRHYLPVPCLTGDETTLSPRGWWPELLSLQPFSVIFEDLICCMKSPAAWSTWKNFCFHSEPWLTRCLPGILLYFFLDSQILHQILLGTSLSPANLKHHLYHRLNLYFYFGLFLDSVLLILVYISFSLFKFILCFNIW